jgi:hypothetical protein
MRGRVQLRITDLGMPLTRYTILLSARSTEIAALGTSTLAAFKSVTHRLILKTFRMIGIGALQTLAFTSHMLSNIGSTGPVTTTGFTTVQRGTYIHGLLWGHPNIDT